MATGADIVRAAEILRRGGLVAFPTETVYGLGADAGNPAALARLYAVKGRPGNHPVIVHVGAPSQLADWAADVPEAARRLGDALWPGPLTVVVRRAASVPHAVTGGGDTRGRRRPRPRAGPRPARRARAAPRLRQWHRGTVRQPFRAGEPDHRRRRASRPR